MSEKEWLEEILYDGKYPVDGDQLQQAAIYGIDKTLDTYPKDWNEDFKKVFYDKDVTLAQRYYRSRLLLELILEKRKVTVMTVQYPGITFNFTTNEYDGNTLGNDPIKNMELIVRTWAMNNISEDVDIAKGISYLHLGDMDKISDRLKEEGIDVNISYLYRLIKPFEGITIERTLY